HTETHAMAHLYLGGTPEQDIFYTTRRDATNPVGARSPEDLNPKNAIVGHRECERSLTCGYLRLTSAA
ncbi:hypothetical protein, partial [Micromonospora psammae]|uniref:hypothetical protein n=1 Tax=Micromonospora sp. CPCC 205556 TaxID=3122398 RepID=UPI002FF182E2